jgi:hypothetical protein
MISGKVVRVPGAHTDITVPDGSTIADVLQQWGQSPSANEEIRLNAIVTPVTTVLQDGFRIMLTQGAKGNK